MQSSIAAIHTTDNRSVAGMGVLVDSRHVLTCAHVVNAAVGRDIAEQAQPDDTLSVGFPLADTLPATARVVQWLPMDEARSPEDIAVLRLSIAVPLKPARFITATQGDAVSAYGFPAGSWIGNWHDGRVLGPLANGWYQIDDDADVGVFLQPGFSGAPVWDDSRRYVLGLVVEAEVRYRTGAMIPTAHLAQQWESLAVVNPLEEILSGYGADCIRQWNAACADEEDLDKLTHFVEPHYSLLKKGRHPTDASSRFSLDDADDAKQETGDPYKPVAVEGDDAEAELLRLLQAGRLLCISEDAGAGKTVFTRRLLAFLYHPTAVKTLFGGRAPLAVRWEEWENQWPDDFPKALADAVRPTCATVGLASAERVVAEALEQQRVILILDALDQVSDTERLKSLSRFLNSPAGKHCRDVLTSRSYAVSQRQTTLFHRGHWRYGRIDRFDRRQQTQYLAGLYDEEPDELFADYDQVSELLSIPVVLSMVRGLAESVSCADFVRAASCICMPANS